MFNKKTYTKSSAIYKHLGILSTYAKLSQSLTKMKKSCMLANLDRRTNISCNLPFKGATHLEVVYPVEEGHIGHDEEENGLQEHEYSVVEPASSERQGHLNP